MIKLRFFVVLVIIISSQLYTVNYGVLQNTPKIWPIQNIDATDPINGHIEVNLTYIAGFNEEWINGRRFLWQTPSNEPPEVGYPVLFLLHGAGQKAETWFEGGVLWGKRQTQFTIKALEHGYMIIAPDSIYPYSPGPKAWDAFSKDFNTSVDLSFFSSMIAWLHEGTVKTDTSRIYCCGFSSGAFMTSRLALFFGLQFRTVVISTGANADYITLTNRGPVFDCRSSQNISTLHPPALIIHGARDRLVPLECGTHYYDELVRNGIEAELIINPWGHHIWQSQYDPEIFAWFDTHN